MSIFKKIFKKEKPIIGMIHIGALPGTPGSNLSVSKLAEQALVEARELEINGIDSIMIENMHDVPYVAGEAGPEIVSAMTAIACLLREKIDLPMGIQILAGASKSSLAVAKSAELQFIRVENFVFGHLADEGFMNSCAADLLRFRRSIDADNIMIFTDIKKKHSSHQITADVSLVEMADTADFFLSDGVIITGRSTSHETDLSDLDSLANWKKLPKLIGSGITEKNLSKYWQYADGFIVGSSLKIGGHWQNAIDSNRVKSFMREVNNLRK